MMQKSFLFDLNKCTGCQACQLACIIENKISSGRSWRQVLTFNEVHYPSIQVIHYSLACNHCLQAPCILSCPALALSRDNETGVILLDDKKCIGCKYCSWVCPYDALQYNYTANSMEKCTFCAPRLKEGKEPACVTGCPTGALLSGEYKNNKNAFAHRAIELPGFPDIGIEPAIELIPLKKDRKTPEMSAFSDTHVSAERINLQSAVLKIHKKITVVKELPLILFTTIAAILVPLFYAVITNKVTIPPLFFIALGAGAFGISTFHLGKKLRAVRAIINWRHSWLSREIILFSVFFALSAGYLLLDITVPIIGWTIITIGALSLIAMDRIYVIRSGISKQKMHSGTVLLTALFWTGIFTKQWLIIYWFAFMKLFLYTMRIAERLKQRKIVLLLISGIRITFGFIIPYILYKHTGNKYISMVINSIVIGELIDRCEFYADFDVISPQKQIDEDLKNIIKHSQKSYYKK